MLSAKLYTKNALILHRINMFSFRKHYIIHTANSNFTYLSMCKHEIRKIMTPIRITGDYVLWKIA